MRRHFLLCIPLALLPSQGGAQSSRPLEGLPPIAEGKLYNSDWGHWRDASSRFGKVLEKRFPAGTDEKQLAQVLIQQGFKYRPKPKPGCVKMEDTAKMPVGKVYVPCPTYDPARLLAYDWEPHELPPRISFACRQTLAVSWEANGGKVTKVKGSFDGICP